MSEERPVLAGGCFWGMQQLLRRYPGVISTRVGYSGGDVRNATCRNHGSHAESIEILRSDEGHLSQAAGILFPDSRSDDDESARE
jgi:peptide-methionine (S)-S-oxide reductase